MTGLPVIVPNWVGVPSHVRGFTTTRRGGTSTGAYGDQVGEFGLNLGDHVGDLDSSVQANRALLAKNLPSEVCYLRQIHSNIVCDASEIDSSNEGDAVFSNRTNQVCAVLTADCLPILFSDLEGRVVAAAHAGWRGLADGVLQQTIRRMKQVGAGDIVAWMGPAIGPTAFEVGVDVLQTFSYALSDAENHFVALPNQPGKYLANIYGLARSALQTVGVNQVYGGDYCTVTESALFYSYRRDGLTGRMASLVWLEASA